ncbi:hypothetical protein SLA2020_219840 [Shorea laevis]
MDLGSFQKLSHVWDILLVNKDKIIPLEKALSMLLQKETTPIEGWDLDTIARKCVSPIVILKGVNPILHLPPPTDWILAHPQLQVLACASPRGPYGDRNKTF